MKFARHLIAHLTPEWRHHYLRYDDLKAKIYEIREIPAVGLEGDDSAETVNQFLQDRFFNELQEQLSMVEEFYKARETKLTLTLRELSLDVNKYELLLANPRTRDNRVTRRKRENLKLLLSEFYLHVSLLQNFQQLNYTGFRKILKKHDKITETTRGKEFFVNNVCKNYFWETPEISRLISTTETLMIDKMEHGNRSKAMNRLRVPPLESKDTRSHWATLRAGWLMGVIFVSIVVIIVGVILRPANTWNHVTPTVRGLRVGLILTLWLYGFAINTFGWRRSGVNNTLIFEFNPRNYLNFVQLFECASAMGVVFLVGVYFTVFSYWLGIPEWAGPVIMLILILVAVLNPLPVLYYRSRFWLLRKLGRIAVAPFFFVEFPDFWIADQMNSLSVVLLDVEYILCYLLFDLTIPGPNVQCGSVSYVLRPIIAALPAWFRFAQCLRRYYDTRQAFPHLVNAGKYSTSFFVVLFGSLTSGLRAGDEDFGAQSPGYYFTLFLWTVVHIVSTTYTFSWDIKMDWGLFEGQYKLRSELIYPHKLYYVLGVIENLLFRSLWTFNILFGANGGHLLDSNILGTILAIAELFRRFVWNFFRLENEHLNNVGEFRAVRDISVHPVDLSRMDDVDETVNKREPPLRNKLARQVSFTLSQVSRPHYKAHKLSLHAMGAEPTIQDLDDSLKINEDPDLLKFHTDGPEVEHQVSEVQVAIQDLDESPKMIRRWQPSSSSQSNENLDMLELRQVSEVKVAMEDLDESPKRVLRWRPSSHTDDPKVEYQVSEVEVAIQDLDESPKMVRRWQPSSSSQSNDNPDMLELRQVSEVKVAIEDLDESPKQVRRQRPLGHTQAVYATNPMMRLSDEDPDLLELYTDRPEVKGQS